MNNTSSTQTAQAKASWHRIDTLCAVLLMMLLSALPIALGTLLGLIFSVLAVVLAFVLFVLKSEGDSGGALILVGLFTGLSSIAAFVTTLLAPSPSGLWPIQEPIAALLPFMELWSIRGVMGTFLPLAGMCGFSVALDECNGR